MCRMCLVEVSGPRGFSLQPACFLPVADGLEVRTASEQGAQGPGGRPRVPARQPPARLPGLRQGRRVPAAGPGALARPGREPLRRGKAALGEADRDRPARLPRPGALHPVRPLHPLRRRRSPARPLIDFAVRGDRIEVATFPDAPLQLVLLAATRCRSARSARSTASPYRFKVAAVGPRAGRDDVHDVLGRLPRRRPVLRRQARALPRRRRRAGQPELALRQGPLRLRGGQRREPFHRAARPPRRRARARALARGAPGRRGRGPPGAGADRAGGNRRHRRRAPLERGRLRLGEAGQVRPRHGLGRRAARRRPAGRAGPRPAEGDDRRRGARQGRRACSDRTCARSCPSSTCGSARRRCTGRCRSSSARPRATALGADASARLRYTPGEAVRLAEALAATSAPGEVPGADAASIEAARRLLGGALASDDPKATRGDGVVVVLGRPSLAESAESIAAAAASLHEAWPGARFLAALRRANVHGALDMGLAPGLLPGRVELEEGRRWFADAWGALPEVRGRDTRGILQAAAAGEISLLVLLGADPLADFPDHSLARAALENVDLLVSIATHPDASTDLARHRAPGLGRRRAIGLDDELRGAGEPPRAKGRAAGHRLGGVDDRRRDSRAGSAPTSASRTWRRSPPRSPSWPRRTGV